MIVVVNTSPLVALDRIGQLHLLQKLFGTIVRPQAVVDELLEGRATYGGSDTLYSAEWIQTYPTPEEIIFRKELGAGETAAIILAKKQNANLLLLDDLAARRVAAELNVPVSGTIGVLNAAHQKGLLPDIEKQLNALIECGFRISENLLKSILKY